MNAPDLGIREMHWMMDVLSSIDVGLMVIDRNFRVQVWNNFMENHSARTPAQVVGHEVFELFDDFPQDWFRRKVESVLLLKCRAFTTWEERPYLFRFRNYRPITGATEFMYQNSTFMPLKSADGEISHVGVIIYDVTDIAVSKRELQTANGQLEYLSRTDGLTGLNNRAYWEHSLNNEFRRAKRTQEPCVLMMLDIDHFKIINDTYGHQAGDEVLRRTADALHTSVRNTDIPGRYGGEEFAIVLIDTTAEGARIVGERLRHDIESTPVCYEGKKICYTISLGVAELESSMYSPHNWIECADHALYEAKHNGRNRIVFYEGN